MPDYHTLRKTKIVSQYGLFRRTEAVLQQLIGVKFDRVLDLGTADGMMLRTLTDDYPNCLGIGIDYDPRFLKFAQNDGLNVGRADGRRQPFPSGSFDVIIATAVFKHVKRLDILLEECYRILKPNGIIAIPQKLLRSV